MNQLLEDKLAKDFPFMSRQLATVNGRDIRITNNYDLFGCEVGDGWYDLLYELCEKITGIYKQHGVTVDIVVSQVKEKYGGLCFYYYRKGLSEDEEINSAISQQLDETVLQFEEKSEHICEECGKEGKLREDLEYILALCDDCNEKRNEYLRHHKM